LKIGLTVCPKTSKPDDNICHITSQKSTDLKNEAYHFTMAGAARKREN